MPACRALKIAYQSGPVSLSIAATAPLASPAPYWLQAVSRVAARSVIGPRTDWANSRRAVAYCFCLSACTPSTSWATRSLLSLREMRSAKATACSTSPPTSSERKAWSQQLDVLRIAFQGGAVIGGGGFGVAHLPGVTGRQITARGGQAGEVLRRRRLGDKPQRRHHENDGQRAAGEAPGEARKCHGRCSNKAAVR